MSLKFDINLLLEVSDFFVSPHIADFVFLPFVKTWDLAEVCSLSDGFVKRVHDEDVNSALGTARVVFSRVGLVPRPSRVDTPLVRESGCTPDIVLVKSEELPIL